MNKDHLTVTPDTGGGNGTLTITAQPNNTANSRTVIVTVSGGGVTRNITVGQDRFSFDHSNSLVEKMTIVPSLPLGVQFEYDLQSGFNVNGNIYLNGQFNKSFVVVIHLILDSRLTVPNIQRGTFVNQNGNSVPWILETSGLLRIQVPTTIENGIYVSPEGSFLIKDQGHNMNISFGIAVRVNQH